MLGLLVILVISWVLMRLIEKKNIDVIGIIPNINRLGQFVIGFCVIAFAVLINIYLQTLILNIEWQLNTLGLSTVWNAFLYHLKSALTEDLVFRGAILYILIHRIGATKAIWLSAIVFGIYHWFSYGVLQERPVLLVYVFLVTGFTGYVWAYSFYKTQSIALGLGFHLGYNLIMSLFYEAQPYGELLLHIASQAELSEWNKLYLSLFKGLFPTVFTLISLKLLLRSSYFNRTKIELPRNN